jgi:hypothetical protein
MGSRARAISAANRDSVGCEASPGPLSGVSPAAELTASAARRIVAQLIRFVMVRATLALTAAGWCGSKRRDHA